MQFINNGPDVPDSLIQDHEDGDVVFFCGAGISIPAGLPTFKGLVKTVFKALNGDAFASAKTEREAERYDAAIGILESEIVGGRSAVREEVKKCLLKLTPKIEANSTLPKTLQTHEALLTLARNREGGTWLVTTNFDRLFETVIEEKFPKTERFSAPTLPMLKRSSWDGLVYLHGLLDENPTDRNLERLVLSSGDFGKAYLTERWAARFVSELFRECTVCFVGYSLDDPILRYMTDAFEADRSTGKNARTYIFSDYSQEQKKEVEEKWHAKNVTPILYEADKTHSYLHETLQEWARIYDAGVRGKEELITKHAGKDLRLSTKQDDFVSRVIWALSDPTGLPAKRFSERDPTPSLDWMEKFNTFQSFKHLKSPRGGWDKISNHMANWLVRHLHDPALLFWILKEGGELHENFVQKIRVRIECLEKNDSIHTSSEQDDINAKAPRAIPSQAMLTLWRLFLAGRIKLKANDSKLFAWSQRFKRDGLTPTLRLELKDCLTPYAIISRFFSSGNKKSEPTELQRISDLVHCKIGLSDDYVVGSLKECRETECWKEALPKLLLDLYGMLRDAVDLQRELDMKDFSYIYRRSISEHSQNQDRDDWTALIGLARDSWMETQATSPTQAQSVAEMWMTEPYPVFKRLAFFAAAQGAISPELAVEWLLAEEHWWLWANDTDQEVSCLLCAVAPRLTKASLNNLEAAILAGPPQSLFREDLNEDALTLDEKMWLRLQKLKTSGAALNPKAQQKLDDLTEQHPEWRFGEDEREEFQIWSSGCVWGDSGVQTFISAPRKRRDLIEWLKANPNKSNWQGDNWPQLCRESFAVTACALYALAREGKWPSHRWGEALNAWSTDKHLKQSWCYIGPILAKAPDDVLSSFAHNICSWLKAVIKSANSNTNTNIGEPLIKNEEFFFAIADRILALGYGESTGRIGLDCAMTTAINHPIGKTTQILFDWWHKYLPEDKAPKEEQDLPKRLKRIFTQLCNPEIPKFQHGQVILASRLTTLFYVDESWTTQHLLPLFEWNHPSAKAHIVWQGFLWSPYLYPPLIKALKPNFLKAAAHYQKLGENAKTYANFFTSAALNGGDIFTGAELREATQALPDVGLERVAFALVSTLESSDERRSEYWTNRIAPYLKNIWPKSKNRASPRISEKFGRLCIAAQDEFPKALNLLRDWLQPPEREAHLVHRLNESGLCEKFPRDALEFLDLVIRKNPSLLSNSLRGCLETISQAEPELETEQRFIRLSSLVG